MPFTRESPAPQPEQNPTAQAATVSPTPDILPTLQPVPSEKPTTEGNPAAETQSAEPADLQLTTKVRAAILDTKNLSAMARDVNVVSDKNRVTLRGQVESAAEKSKLEEAARKAAGSATVVSELEIAK
jgi:hypothetical protein